jgi:hypothetical protein
MCAWFCVGARRVDEWEVFESGGYTILSPALSLKERGKCSALSLKQREKGHGPLPEMQREEQRRGRLVAAAPG